MLIEKAAEALRTQRQLELRYETFSRHVEVHAIGYSRTGRAILRAWVRSGRRGELRGWKLLDLAEALDAEISEASSSAPRRGYRRSDPGIERIVCEL